MIKNKNLILKNETKDRGGFLSLELLGVLTVITVIGAAIFTYLGQSNTQADIADATSQLGFVQSAVKTKYTNESTYNGLDEADLVNSSQIPRNMVNGNTLVNAFGGAIDVTSNAASGDVMFDITFEDLPQDACAALAGLKNSNIFEVSVNGGAAAASFSPSEVQDECDQEVNDITWTYY